MKVTIELETKVQEDLNFLKEFFYNDKPSIKESKSIEVLNLPPRIEHALFNGGISTVYELKNQIKKGNYYSLTKIRLIKVKSCLLIEEALKKYDEQ